MINVSIILPTINEAENLKNLIPNIEAELRNTKILSYEIIIVDDGSTDNTKEIIKEFNKNDRKIFLIERTKEPSLPKSIYEGINAANFDYVLWLDADGSMPPKDVAKLVQEQINNPNDVIIGSRFVEGGGYKGATIDSNTSIFQSMRNIYNSEDSILAVLLSRWFNIFLANILSLVLKILQVDLL
jgi:dolichol-phosphate mannosyltransferase